MNLNEALAVKTEKRMSAVAAADVRRAQLHALVPRIAVIDAEISELPFKVLQGGDIEALRKNTESLIAERERLLKANGFDADYDEPVFECAKCRDSGYTEGLKLCDCVKKLALSTAYAESSILARGLADKSFDNFIMDYYKTDERGIMNDVLAYCKKYAESFPPRGISGLLFTGGTGLGKTHLSAAIANVVANNGHYTVYETAQQIIDTCDGVRFNKLPVAEKEKYENCELLLIDDLGAECRTGFSVAAVCNLIDLRMVNGRQTVISTNLAPKEISSVYGERLLSRLLGEFRVIKFVGSDIRMQKISGGKR